MRVNMKVNDKELLSDIVKVFKFYNIESEVIENKYIKNNKPIVSIMNTDYYVSVKQKKNSGNIFFLYKYNENEKVKNKWLLGSIDIFDIIEKLKKMKKLKI